MSYRSCVHAALRTPSKCCLYKPSQQQEGRSGHTGACLHTCTHTTRVHVHAHVRVLCTCLSIL